MGRISKKGIIMNYQEKIDEITKEIQEFVDDLDFLYDSRHMFERFDEIPEAIAFEKVIKNRFYEYKLFCNDENSIMYHPIGYDNFYINFKGGYEEESPMDTPHAPGEIYWWSPTHVVEYSITEVVIQFKLLFDDDKMREIRIKVVDNAEKQQKRFMKRIQEQIDIMLQRNR